LKLISSKPGKPPQPIAFVSFKLRKQAEKALSELQVSLKGLEEWWGWEKKGAKKIIIVCKCSELNRDITLVW